MDKNKNRVTMFYAVYENGAVVSRTSFEMLPQTEDILFYAKSEEVLSHTYYHILNTEGKINPLQLNKCKLIGIIQNNYNGYHCAILEFEIPKKGVEKLEIGKYEWEAEQPLSVTASIVDKINHCGYYLYLAFRELWEKNSELDKGLELLEDQINTLEEKLVKLELNLTDE